MNRRQILIEAEDVGFREVLALLGARTRDELLREGTLGGWSGKDVVAHIGCWAAEAATALEQIRMETYTSTRLDIEAMNQQFREAFADRTVEDAWSELWSARNRMLEEWGRLDEVTREAEEWFEESGASHYEEHLPDLRAWVEGLGSAS